MALLFSVFVTPLLEHCYFCFRITSGSHAEMSSCKACQFISNQHIAFIVPGLAQAIFSTKSKRVSIIKKCRPSRFRLEPTSKQDVLKAVVLLFPSIAWRANNKLRRLRYKPYQLFRQNDTYFTSAMPSNLKPPP